MGSVDISLVSIVISLLSFALSATTYWLLYLHKGKILMTQPTLIVIYNDLKSDGRKIFLRTLLISTAKSGNILENLFIRVKNDRSTQDFSFWGYKDKEMSHGSGLYIPENGCVYDHHFSLWPKDTTYRFMQGKYEIEMFASIIGHKNKILLKRIKLEMTSSQCDSIEKGGKVYFYWDNNQRQYVPELIAQQK